MALNELSGDLWTFPATYRCITTNGFVKDNGEAVMGRGNAAQAANLYPTLPLLLGSRLTHEGNNVHLFDNLKLITFPVKHNWFDSADITLIERSCHQLNDLIATLPKDATVILPRPGADNGKLDWHSEVKPIVESIIDSPQVGIVSYAWES